MTCVIPWAVTLRAGVTLREAARRFLAAAGGVPDGRRRRF